MADSISRRTFVKTAVLASAATPLLYPRRAAARSPNERLNIAFVGVGGICGRHTNDAFNAGAGCPCYCDADSKRMDNAAKRWPDARAYTDYREMFDKHHKDIDAVMVGTPDHSHYPATMIAMQLGKHVFTQKPLTHTVWESRQLFLATRKYKLATQMGNQGHAGEGNRQIVEYVRSGMLGQIREIHCWTNRPIWPQGVGRPEGEDPIPENLNWDAWIGPAAMRPFKSGVYHAFNWRGWLDFGAGALGDMACHTMDSVFWSMEPGYPTAVEPVAATPVNDETFPNASVVKWEFPARGGRPAFDVYWYDGGLRPKRPVELEQGRDLPNTGNLYLGSRATLLVAGDYGERPRIIPEEKALQLGPPPKMLDRSPGHMQEWVMACRGEKSYDYPGSNFQYAAPFTETVLLGNVALSAGKRLEWDGDGLEVTNLPEANALISKEYREGWKFTL
ncbi:MAG: Gfo/Idh/MocA family oxidoreductase [Phycisphaerales bacterium]|nr:MAG: Gfo/Idh/MocA family oxidoreductase [Phycisphaerales bacterium]